MTDTEIDDNLKKYSSDLLAKKFGKQVVVVAATAGVGKNVSDSKKIDKYLDEHPNSKLSRKEILKLVKKEEQW